MIEQINKLIDINLLLCSEQKSLALREFRNDEGKQLPGAKMLADIMQQKDLIKPDKNRDFSYELTENGKYVAENGGWLKYSNKAIKDTPAEFISPEEDSPKLNKGMLILGIIIVFLSVIIVSCI